MTQSLSSLDRAAGEDPTHRAIFAGRRLILVPWERGIEPGSDPFDPAPRSGGEERSIVFDIWEDDDGDGLLARQHGAGEASTEVEALHRWAERSGAYLKIGAPLGPAAAHVGPRVEIPTATAPEPPAFRLVYSDPVTGADRLRVSPWGFVSDGGISRLRRPWRGAVAEGLDRGEDRLLIRFAHVDRGYRGPAERAIREWAAKDEWAVHVASGLHHLTVPAEPVPATHSGASVCPGCGLVSGTGFAAHMGWARRAWIPTRCECGARRVWFGRSERLDSHGP